MNLSDKFKEVKGSENQLNHEIVAAQLLLQNERLTLERGKIYSEIIKNCSMAIQNTTAPDQWVDNVKLIMNKATNLLSGMFSDDNVDLEEEEETNETNS